jgi:hypothetical protein
MPARTNAQWAARALRIGETRAAAKPTAEQANATRARAARTALRWLTGTHTKGQAPA